MAVKQTAGRTQLGEFAPKFAELNDDGGIRPHYIHTAGPMPAPWSGSY